MAHTTATRKLKLAVKRQRNHLLVDNYLQQQKTTFDGGGRSSCEQQNDTASGQRENQLCGWCAERSATNNKTGESVTATNSNQADNYYCNNDDHFGHTHTQDKISKTLPAAILDLVRMGLISFFWPNREEDERVGCIERARKRGRDWSCSFVLSFARCEQVLFCLII